MGLQTNLGDLPSLTFEPGIAQRIARCEWRDIQHIKQNQALALASIKAKLGAKEEYTAHRSGEVIKRLGNPKGLSVSRPDLGAAAVSAKARVSAVRVVPTIRRVQTEEPGLSLSAIAARLNAMHVLSAAGKPWPATGVKRVLDRAN